MKMKNPLIAISLLFVLTTTSYAYALELDQAKSRGLVGETPSGYLASVKGSADSEVSALIDEINKKRRNKYVQISKKNGTTLAAVEALAGKKAIEKTAPGNYVQTPSGWKKK